MTSGKKIDPLEINDEQVTSGAQSHGSNIEHTSELQQEGQVLG